MIEKLEEKKEYEIIGGRLVQTMYRNLATPNEMQNKINEIIDYLNKKENEKSV